MTRSALLLLATSLIAAAADQPPPALNVAAFGARSGDGSDTTPAVRAALEEGRRTKAARLSFAPRRYDFWPDRAVEKYLFISNNDEGLKRVAFPLFGLENLEIDGQGAQFVFHGFVTPFVLDHSRNITLKNFSVDWKRTFHSEGRILAVGEDTVDLEIPEQFPYKLQSGLIVFTGEGKDLTPFGNLLEFDVKKLETAYMARDYYTGPNVQAVAIGPRQVRLTVPKFEGKPGNILVFGALNRLIPGITISDSVGVKLAAIDIYHCGWMGVIAQRSQDIELDHIQVTPAPGSGRIVSITADATHFVNCTGRIVISHCLFENQKDDATNIHGIYAQVTRQISPNQIEVKLVHPQQFGFDFIRPGDRLELVHGPSMLTYAEAAVKAAERQNAEYTLVTFAAALPREMKTGDVVASIEYPDVTIRNSTFRSNRARGLLLGSRGKIVVEDNLFHIAGAAILMEGDASFWFEQAGVRDMVIQRNRFDNCNFGVWGKATIEVRAGIAQALRAASRYNRNIVIEDNVFRVFDDRPLVKAYSVDGMTIRNNRIERTADYPPLPVPAGAKAFDITESSNIRIEP
jgi:hypothetical protein